MHFVQMQGCDMDRLAYDALFIRWGEFQTGAFGRVAIVMLAIMMTRWLAPILVRYRRRRATASPKWGLK
jgi:hypothetical protein